MVAAVRATALSYAVAVTAVTTAALSMAVTVTGAAAVIVEVNVTHVMQSPTHQVAPAKFQAQAAAAPAAAASARTFGGRIWSRLDSSGHSHHMTCRAVDQVAAL